VENQKESYQAIINACLFLTPFLLGGIGILLVVIIWNQYRIEKRNMKAFIKISPTGVKDISDQLVKFRKSLINDESFESRWLSNMSEDFEALQELEYNSTYSTKHNSQLIKYEDFRKRYFKYIFRVTCYTLILIGITIWDLVSTQKAIRVIYNRQGQLQFANYLSNRATTGYSAFLASFITNNTLMVERETAKGAMYDAIWELKKIQGEIPSRFLEIDGNYNPDVKSIIFDNNPTCKGFTSDVIRHCNYLLSQGQPVNMMVASSAFQNMLKERYQAYINNNVTTLPELWKIALTKVDIFLSTLMTIAYEAQMIVNIMDKTLTEKISENRHARNLIMVIFSISLVIFSILIWIDILRVIRDVYNDFKKVLQVVPPNLVLSSYLLKKFLHETSNQLKYN